MSLFQSENIGGIGQFDRRARKKWEWKRFHLSGFVQFVKNFKINQFSGCFDVVSVTDTLKLIVELQNNVILFAKWFYFFKNVLAGTIVVIAKAVVLILRH